MFLTRLERGPSIILFGNGKLARSEEALPPEPESGRDDQGTPGQHRANIVPLCCNPPRSVRCLGRDRFRLPDMQMTVAVDAHR